MDSVCFHAQQVDVGCRTEQPVLQVLAKAVIDGQRDDEGGDAGRDSNNRNDGDDADNGLATLGSEISRGNEKFKLHLKKYQPEPRNGQVSL